MSEPVSWLRYGANHGLQILVIEPLFEEANRCRRLVAEVMRGLDRHGIGSVLAQLPGTSEDLQSIAEIRLGNWIEAVGTYRPHITASFRGGALVDGGDIATWRFAPETGARIVRDLRRASLASSSETLFAGHPLSEEFIAELEAATPTTAGRIRTLRLESDAAEADFRVSGAPLWRRAEPGDDPVLARALADDLVKWVRQCAAA